MFRLFLLVMVAVIALPASAGARGPVPPAGHYSARLLDCDVDIHTATFRGSVRVFKGAPGLEMSFSLQSRAPGVEKFAAVGAPTFGQWLTAEMGHQRYVYDKTVENLPVGSTFRALVRFRWRDADGDVVARAKSKTAACVQPETRPNLRPVSIRARTVGDTGTRAYDIGYVNDGASDSGPFSIGLTIDGVPLADATDDDGAPDDGVKQEVTLIGPACVAGQTLIATVDTAGVVPESDEADNTYTLPCPTSVTAAAHG